MAPELIVAMDVGIYDYQVDIWSMGITCYELGEKQPPLFHLNPVSAMYHIAQNDPPQLLNAKWSEDFKNFANSMLQKDATNRPTAESLISHPFLKICEGFSFIEIIQKCSTEAQIKNENSLKNFLKIINQKDKSVSDDSEQNSDASKSNELVDEFSQISIAKKNKIGTIKTIDVINQEIDKKQEAGYLKLRDYQAMRRENSKKILALDQKLSAEISNLQKSQQRSFDLLKCTNAKAVKFIHDKFEEETEKQKKKFKAELKKILKEKVTNASERRNVYNSLLNVDFLCPDTLKFFVSLSASSSPAGSLSKSNVDLTADDPKEYPYGQDCEKVVSENISQIRELNKNMLLEKQKLLISQRQYMEKNEIFNNSQIVQKELMKLEKIYQTKEKLLIKLHEYETTAQKECAAYKLTALKKEHVQNLKTRPRDFKIIEAKLSRVFKNDIKVINTQFKQKLKALGEKSGKEDYAKNRNRLEMEKVDLIMSKKKEMEDQISASLAENMKFEEFQTKEFLDLENLLYEEAVSLTNYQNSQLEQMKRTKMNDLQCIHQKFEEIGKDIKKNAQKDIDHINYTINQHLEKIQKPFEFSFDQFMLKSLSNSDCVDKELNEPALPMKEKLYSSLYLSKRSKKKCFPQF